MTMLERYTPAIMYFPERSATFSKALVFYMYAHEVYVLYIGIPHLNACIQRYTKIIGDQLG